MTRNYMRVVVYNESSATLRLKHSWTSRSWTPGGWAPENNPLTPPGDAFGWQAEGNSLGLIVAAVPLDGVEARAWYDVVDANGAVVGELYIFANSPWIESPYGNTFHVRAPADYFATYVDANGQKSGNRAILEIRFRDSGTIGVLGFSPKVNGFAFSNGDWSDALPVLTLGELWNQLALALPGDLLTALGIGFLSDAIGPITDAGDGLCGGMAFAAMDYYYAGQLPPLADVSTGTPMPPDKPDDPLFLFIRERLFDSMDFRGRGSRWLSYTSPMYPDGDEGVGQALGLFKGKSWVTYREEWPRIREQLDQGKFATIGLIQSDSFAIDQNHQVLAYAYRQSGQNVLLWVYDSLRPADDNVILSFDTTNTTDRVRVGNTSGKDIFAILYCDAYSQRIPPGGRAVPPPGRPKWLVLSETGARSETTGGVETDRKQNQCGEPIRIGTWTSKTTVSFVAQVSGFMEPVGLAWSVHGVRVPDIAGPLRIQVDGKDFEIDVGIAIGGRALSVASRSGDTYKVLVRVDMADALGESRQAEGTFDVAGSYDGPRIEDIAAAVECIARTIPVPVDLYTLPEPGPVEAPLDRLNWQQDALARVAVDPALDDQSRALLRGFVVEQATLPELRAPLQLNRGVFRIDR